LKTKVKFGETVEAGEDETSVETDVRRSSLATFERLQEEIIELESNKRRLRRSVDQLRDEERLLARRLDRRSRDAGIIRLATASLTTVIQCDSTK